MAKQYRQSLDPHFSKASLLVLDTTLYFFYMKEKYKVVSSGGR